MSTESVLTIISYFVTAVTGVILWRQISSQKELIIQYKGYIEAVNPEKVIALHKRQIELITSLNNQTQQQLKEQVFELGWYVTHILSNNEKAVKSINDPNFFYSSDSVIGENMPHCISVLADIRQQYNRQLKTPNP